MRATLHTEGPPLQPGCAISAECFAERHTLVTWHFLPQKAPVNPVGSIAVDDSEWPLVRVVYPERLEPAVIDVYAEVVRGLGERGEYWVLIDLRQVHPRAATQELRNHLAERMNAVHRDLPGRVQGEAAVSASFVVRAYYSAYQWLRRNQSFPARIFPTERAARIWLDRLRSGHGHQQGLL